METGRNRRRASVNGVCIFRWILAMRCLCCCLVFLKPTGVPGLSTTICPPVVFVNAFSSPAASTTVRRRGHRSDRRRPHRPQALNVVADPTRKGNSSVSPPAEAAMITSRSSSSSPPSASAKRKPPRVKATSSPSSPSSKSSAASSSSSSSPTTSRSRATGPSTGSNGDGYSFPSPSMKVATPPIVSGAVGNWESLHGNWVLRPSGGQMEDPPRAVIHFLGGALVGASPQITYRYLLEKLAVKGFLVVATPYNLSFDHLATCDDVLTRFEDLAPTLAREYGALAVVGIGHSCGALLQLLITCLFPDTPRAANALLSFNNKPVSEAVPFFEEIFAPAFTSIATPARVTNPLTGVTVERPSSNESLVLMLKLARAASRGRLPSDELLQEAVRVFGASLPLPVPPPPPFVPNVGDLFGFVGGGGDDGEATVKVPTELRDAYAMWAAPSVAALSEAGVLPLIHETILSLEQIPKLVEEVAQGARDFNPTPSLVRSAAGKAYRARRTLIIGYEDDPIDESDEVEEVLREARSITRMRRPMVEIDVQRRVLGGGHAAPLIAPPLDVAVRAEDLLGLEVSQERLGYSQAAATVDDLVRWLEEGNL